MSCNNQTGHTMDDLPNFAPYDRLAANGGPWGPSAVIPGTNVTVPAVLVDFYQFRNFQKLGAGVGELSLRCLSAVKADISTALVGKGGADTARAVIWLTSSPEKEPWTPARLCQGPWELNELAGLVDGTGCLAAAVLEIWRRSTNAQRNRAMAAIARGGFTRDSKAAVNHVVYAREVAKNASTTFAKIAD